MAELGFGNLKDCRNGIVLVLGTAIGGAIIIDHKLYLGSHDLAGNFSFLDSDIDHPGDKEHKFNAYNGINGLKKAIYESSGLEDIDGIRCFELIRQGNKEVEKGLEKFCDHLVYQIGNLCLILDPERILIGGGISKEEKLIDYIREAMERKRSENRFISDKIEIRNCFFNNDANLLGALYHWKTKHRR